MMASRSSLKECEMMTMMKMMVLATMRTMQVTMLIVMLVRMLSLMPTVTREIITAVKKMTMPTARMYRCSSCRDIGARDDGNRGRGRRIENTSPMVVRATVDTGERLRLLILALVPYRRWRSCQQSLLLHAGRLHLRQEEREAA